MKLGIRMQLILLFSLPLFLVSLTIGSLMTSHRIGDINRSLDRRGAELVEQLIRMSEFYLFTGNKKELRDLGDRILRLEKVLAVEFKEPNNNTIVRRSLDDDGSKNKKTFISAVYSTGLSVNDYEMEAANKDLLLGYILLELSLSDKNRLKNNVIYRGALLTGIIMIFGIFVGGCFGYRMSSRLENITETVAGLRAGLLTSRCNENGAGELLSLQAGINSMAETIEKNDVYLREQVEAATLALKNTVKELENKNTLLARANESAIQFERERALTEERERIMQDMHDGIGGQLVASMAILENYQFSGLDSENAYKEIRSLLRDSLDDLRLVIDSLDSSTDKLSVLLGMFRHRTQKRIEAAGIKIKWDVVMLPESIAFSPQENLHILRIIQEAITNVIKHANANIIMFSVAMSEETVHICIRDNGVGNMTPTGRGRGIANMYRRAKELGAVLSIIQTPQGRSVDLYLSI